MRIEISAEPDPPLQGEVRVDGGATLPFAGWLSLLSILAETLPLPSSVDTTAAPAHRPREQKSP